MYPIIDRAISTKTGTLLNMGWRGTDCCTAVMTTKAENAESQDKRNFGRFFSSIVSMIPYARLMGKSRATLGIKSVQQALGGALLDGGASTTSEYSEPFMMVTKTAMKMHE